MRRARFLLSALAPAALALAAPNPAAAQSNPEGERLVQQGQQAFQLGNFADAAQILWQATLADEAVRDNAALQTLRGRAVMRSGRPDTAVNIFDRIGGDPLEYADAMYWRGEALMMMTEPELAADSYRTALEFDPNHPLARNRLSYLPAEMDVPDAPEPELVDSIPTDIIAAEPTQPARARSDPPPAASPAPAPQFSDDLADVQPPNRSGPTPLIGAPAPPQPEAAPPAEPAAPAAPAGAPPEDRAEIRAGDLDPDALANVARGRTAFAAGDYRDAAVFLWRATTVDEAVRTNAAIQILRGQAVMRGGDPATAVAVFESVASRSSGPDAAEALFWRGQALTMAGRPGEAAEAYRMALRLDPTHAQARRQLRSPGPVEPGPPPEINFALDAAPGDEAPADARAEEPVVEFAEAPAAAEVTMAELESPALDVPGIESGAAGVILSRPAPAPEIALAELAAPGIDVPDLQAQPAPAPLVVEEEPAPAPEPVALAEAPKTPPRAPAASEFEDGPGAPVAEATALRLRELAADRRAAQDRTGEADALSELYLTQLATPEEIARYAELVNAGPSPVPNRDFQIARLAEVGGHFELAAALYRAVDASGAVEGSDLAVLRTNLATVQLLDDRPDAAIEAANRAIAVDEAYPNAWAIRALAHESRGDLGKALEDAKQAFDRGTRAPPVLALLQAAGFNVTPPAPPPEEEPEELALRGSQ